MTLVLDSVVTHSMTRLFSVFEKKSNNQHANEMNRELREAKKPPRELDNEFLGSIS